MCKVAELESGRARTRIQAVQLPKLRTIRLTCLLVGWQMLDQNMEFSNTQARAPFSVPGGLKRGGRRSGSMYLSLLRARVDSNLHDPQKRSTEAPTLCFQARPLLALAVAPEMKSLLSLGQPVGLSDGQRVLQTLEIIPMSPQAARILPGAQPKGRQRAGNPQP